MRRRLTGRLAVAGTLLLTLMAAECSRLPGDDPAAEEDAAAATNQPADATTAETPAATPAATETTRAGARVVNTEVRVVAPTTFVQYIRVVGEVEPLHDITLSAEESGTIAELLVEKGATVAAGQPLARIGAKVLEAQIEEAAVLAEVARERFERQQRLWKEERIGTEMALLELRSQATSAAARLQVLETRYARTMVASPVAGVFDEQYVDIGELVAPGTRVARVVATGRVKVAAGIPERFALALTRGAPALVTFDVLEGRELAGTLDFVGTGVDPQNRTIPVEILLDNRDRLIRPRMVANVQVERLRLERVIVVPQDLVQRTESGFQVFVAERDGAAVTAQARAVELGPSYADRVVIETGLDFGDRLIVSGHRQVDDGSAIRVVQR